MQKLQQPYLKFEEKTKEIPQFEKYSPKSSAEDQLIQTSLTNKKSKIKTRIDPDWNYYDPDGGVDRLINPDEFLVSADIEAGWEALVRKHQLKNRPFLPITSRRLEEPNKENPEQDKNLTEEYAQLFYALQDEKNVTPRIPELLIFPIHHSEHWTVLVVKPGINEQATEYRYVDPMGHREIPPQLEAQIIKIYPNAKKVTDIEPDPELQKDGTSCGLWQHKIADLFLTRKNIRASLAPLAEYSTTINTQERVKFAFEVVEPKIIEDRNNKNNPYNDPRHLAEQEKIRTKAQKARMGVIIYLKELNRRIKSSEFEIEIGTLYDQLPRLLIDELYKEHIRERDPNKRMSESEKRPRFIKWATLVVTTPNPKQADVYASQLVVGLNPKNVIRLIEEFRLNENKLIPVEKLEQHEEDHDQQPTDLRVQSPLFQTELRALRLRQ